MSYLNGLVVFSTFFNLSLNGNKEFMIWATVSSQSCFCWLYRASPSLAAKNIINLISVLTIWWCPCVESSLVLLVAGVCYDWCVLLANSINYPVPCFILYSKTKSACYSRCFLTSYFCTPIPYNEKETSLAAQMVKHLPTMRETRVQSLGWEDPLQKEMEAQSSTLGWKIPWMEGHGGLQSLGSQRIRHDWATSLHFIMKRTSFLGVSSRRSCRSS